MNLAYNIRSVYFISIPTKCKLHTKVFGGLRIVTLHATEFIWRNNNEKKTSETKSKQINSNERTNERANETNNVNTHKHTNTRIHVHLCSSWAKELKKTEDGLSVVTHSVVAHTKSSTQVYNFYHNLCCLVSIRFSTTVSLVFVYSNSGEDLFMQPHERPNRTNWYDTYYML